MPDPPDANAVAEFRSQAAVSRAGRIAVRLARDDRHIERFRKVLAQFRQQLACRFRVRPIRTVEE